MSSTTQPKRVGQLDAFYTDPDCAKACVGLLGNLHGVRCWEPHAGGGAFVEAVWRAGAVVHWSDIDPDALAYHKLDPRVVGSAYEAHDALSGWPWSFRDPPSLIVGNPPYNAAEAHVRAALRVSTDRVAFLLRMGFLATAKRLPLWREHPPAEIHQLVQRPSFTGGGTDSCEYAFIIWRSGHVGRPAFDWVDWKP